MKTRLQKLLIDKPFNNLSIFITAGFPQKESLFEIIPLLNQTDCDIIEIGIPYSDPLADGTIIQKSSALALSNGMTLNLLLTQVKKVRAHTQKPILLMGYLNSILKFGIEDFYMACYNSGVDGLIIPDLPLFEYKNIHQAFITKYNLSFSFLITPTTENNRALELSANSLGFVYLVSSNSTTGNTNPVKINLKSQIDSLISEGLNTPVLIGFGIKNNSDFERACSISNGAIIGSAFIEMVQNSTNLNKDIPEFIHSIKNKKHDYSIK